MAELEAEEGFSRLLYHYSASNFWLQVSRFFSCRGPLVAENRLRRRFCLKSRRCVAMLYCSLVDRFAAELAIQVPTCSTGATTTWHVAKCWGTQPEFNMQKQLVSFKLRRELACSLTRGLSQRRRNGNRSLLEHYKYHIREQKCASVRHGRRVPSADAITT
jgi:hypothetical protein